MVGRESYSLVEGHHVPLGERYLASKHLKALSFIVNHQSALPQEISALLCTVGHNAGRRCPPCASFAGQHSHR